MLYKPAYQWKKNIGVRKNASWAASRTGRVLRRDGETRVNIDESSIVTAEDGSQLARLADRSGFVPLTTRGGVPLLVRATSNSATSRDAAEAFASSGAAIVWRADSGPDGGTTDPPPGSPAEGRHLLVSGLSASPPRPPRRRAATAYKPRRPRTASSQPTLTSGGGPLLFTAPHGPLVMRWYAGAYGAAHSQKTHGAEKSTTTLALHWSTNAAAMLDSVRGGAISTTSADPAQGSFIIWDLEIAGRAVRSNIDPNFLFPTGSRIAASDGGKTFDESPWNAALVAFAARVGAGDAATLLGGKTQFPYPTLHVDLHGKKNPTKQVGTKGGGKKGKKGKLVLDIGIASAEADFGDTAVGALFARARVDLIGRMKQFLHDEMSAALASFGYGVNCDPRFHGNWGSGPELPKTLSHQMILLGCPAIQFEMPWTMRLELRGDAPRAATRRDAVLRVICRCFVEVVEPAYAEAAATLRMTSTGPVMRPTSSTAVSQGKFDATVSGLMRDMRKVDVSTKKMYYRPTPKRKAFLRARIVDV